MATGNIQRECEDGCSVTWHTDYGPNGSLPGTRGAHGDVRRCDHGRVWLYEETFMNRYYCSMDRWRALSKFRNWRLHKRAVRALATPDAGEGE